MHEFFTFIKDFILLLLAAIERCLIIIVPAVLAYIAWKQREGDIERAKMGENIKTVTKNMETVKTDVEIVKAVGNSTLREAMQSKLHALEALAAHKDTQANRTAVETARQRLAEHDTGQARGQEAATDAKDRADAPQLVKGEVVLSPDKPKVVVKIDPTK